MAADSKLTLPGLFEKGKNYLLSGDTLMAWKKALLGDRIIPGRHLRESQDPNGRILHVELKEFPSPPLWPTLFKKGETDLGVAIWAVTLTRGVVNERITGDVDALEPVEISNLIWGEDAPAGVDPESPREFLINVGQQISVVLQVAEDGSTGTEEVGVETCVIAITPANAESIHYAPPGGISEGSTGEYYYKLAVLQAGPEAGDPPVLKHFLAGSNLSHFRDLPMMDNLDADSSGEFASVFQKYEIERNKYLFRVLKGVYGLKVSQTDVEVKYHFDGENIGTGQAVLKLPDVEPGQPLPDEPAKFRTIRAMDSGDDDTEDNEPQLRVDIPPDGEDPGETIRVSGNRKKGPITLINQYSEELGTINYQDGLVTDTAKDIEIKELRDGTAEGQIMVWDGASWTFLDPPAGESSSLFVLTCVGGGSPTWTATEDCDEESAP